MYNGLCAKCMTNEAKHKVWLKFNNPQPYPDEVLALAKVANIPLTIPTGVWQFLCDTCR